MTDLNEYMESGSDCDSAPPLERLIDVTREPIRSFLKPLLKDRTSKGNIKWGTDAYSQYGYDASACISEDAIISLDSVKIVPRIEKSQTEQQSRTRNKAEVFTPVWICNLMNNYCDQDWFGRPDVFNHIHDGREWTVTADVIPFSDGKTWKDYVDSRHLEITCGEAPFLVSRYDASTGDTILPLERRIGVFDRKMRIVNENTDFEDDWLKWSIRALESCYGYEYQGDSLLIARCNMFLSFIDYYERRWGHQPNKVTLNRVANVVSWNLWQMDGLKNCIPFSKQPLAQCNLSMFGDGSVPETKTESVPYFSKIYDWRRDNSVIFDKCKKRGKMDKKLFDYVIGNPPYQEINDNNTRQPPVYNKFMDASYEISEKTLLITPARFLFNAGQTPKDWNQKILNDPHFSVVYYDNDAKNIFDKNDIKGGIAIHYHDITTEHEPIGIFIPYPELKQIYRKVVEKTKQYLDELVSSRGLYRYSDLFYDENPDAIDKVGLGTGNMITTNILEKMPEIFSDDQFEGSLKCYGILNGRRVVKHTKKEYVIPNQYLGTFNVLLSKSNNSGKFGESLTESIIAGPIECCTDSFISIGCLSTQIEAINLSKYIKTKFLRSLLGIRKVTQDNPKDVWSCIPVLDFTTQSDIDWSKSIKEIDDQLYRKYGLTNDEIQFIDSHVKEMI